MPKYFDSDELLKKLPDDLPYKASVKRVLIQAPEADVVPKSEYDAVVSAVDNSTKEFLKLHDAYQNAKAEVAREISEEIEERIEVSILCSLDIEEVKGIIAELKKKYTEGRRETTPE
jgi:SMC interacting uncharacterized protein involved in chromosome segregation